MRQCLSVLSIVYRVHVYSFCYLVLPVHQVGLCTAVQGWRETRCTPQSPYTRRRAAPTYTAANLPQPAMLLRGVHNPCNNKIMPKINRSSHFIANKYLRKNLLGHFTENEIPTLLLLSLVGTGFCFCSAPHTIYLQCTQTRMWQLTTAAVFYTCSVPHTR